MKSALRYALSVVIVLVVALVLVEAAVYAIYRPAVPEVVAVNAIADVDSLNVTPGRERAGLGFRDPGMSLHPYLGYVYIPKNRRSPDNPGHPQIPVNDDGFLDANPALRTRGDGRVVIGVLGGSVAGQLGTWYSEHLIEALSGVDVFKGKELDFVWLGMPGYHQPQQVIQLSYLLAQGGEFDVVLNIDGFNELAVPAVLNEPMGAHPLYPMNWSMVALDVPDTEMRRAIGAVDYLQSERNERTVEFASSPWRFSPTARLLRQRDDEKLAARIGAYSWQIHDFAPDSIPYFVSGPERLHVPTDEMVPELVEIWKRASLQMNALCEQAGIRYFHFLQPNQYDPGSKPLTGEERETAYDEASPYKPVVEMGYKQLRNAAAELTAAGVSFHDLSLIFDGVKETLYKDSCCHFNGEGNRIMAEAIAEAIEAESTGM